MDEDSQSLFSHYLLKFFLMELIFGGHRPTKPSGFLNGELHGGGDGCAPVSSWQVDNA